VIISAALRGLVLRVAILDLWLWVTKRIEKRWEERRVEKPSAELEVISPSIELYTLNSSEPQYTTRCTHHHRKDIFIIRRTLHLHQERQWDSRIFGSMRWAQGLEYSV
jgi:hypothetical protein